MKKTVITSLNEEKRKDYFETNADLMGTIRYLVYVIAGLIVVIALLIFANIATLKKQSRALVIAPTGDIFNTREIEGSFRDDVVIKRFAERFCDLFYAFSYKDFDVEVIKAGNSKITNALNLMAPQLKKMTEDAFTAQKIPQMMVQSNGVLGIEILGSEVTKNTAPYEVEVTANTFYAGLESQKTPLRIKLVLMPVKRNEKVLGEYGLEVKGYNQYEGTPVETTTDGTTPNGTDKTDTKSGK